MDGFAEPFYLEIDSHVIETRYKPSSIYNENVCNDYRKEAHIHIDYLG